MTTSGSLPKNGPKLISHELLADCLQRIEAGDPTGLDDLAFFWMGHVTDRDPVIEIGIVEALMQYVAYRGNAEAKEFLSTVWPETRRMLERRLNKPRPQDGT